MRHWFYPAFAALLLATPAAAQSSATGSSSTPQNQAAKDSKAPAAPAKAAPAASDPAPGKEDQSLSNYDVNGSNASDAMATTP